MKILKAILVILIIFIIVLTFLLVDNSERVRISLVECIDGDTAKFIINNKIEKVRFLGIDTPEYTTIKEDYGDVASSYTCSMLSGANNIYIEYDDKSQKRDKYNRVLGWIFIDNNNLSELLLEKGYAEVKYIYGDYKYISNLCNIQELAYKKAVGIWSIKASDYQNNYCVKNNY